VTIGIALFTVIAVFFVWRGVTLLRNRDGRGDRWIESNIPKFFRIGTVDTHRTILGTGYAVMGSLFAVIGIVVLVRSL
jgi:hypothetical protein